MTDEELARRLTEALDARIARAASAPVSREVLNRLPEPEAAEGSVVEAIPIRRVRWRTALAAALAVFLLGAVGLLAYKLAGRNGPTQNPIPAQSGSTEETWTTEPTEEVSLPELSYNEETGTLRVVGTKGYDRLDLTPYLSDAKILEVEDDEFLFSADVSFMNSLLEQNSWIGVQGYVDLLDRSTAYIRQFIKDRTTDERIVAQIDKPIHYSLQSRIGAYSTNGSDKIRLELGFDYLEYDARYALSLMNPAVDSWQYLGFAYWLGSQDPYGFASGYEGTPIPPDYDYFYLSDYFRVGGTGKTWETKEKLLSMDACSWYNLTRGMGWAGENAERSPIGQYDGSAGTPEEEGNDMSLFMAISLTNYLAEQFGADRVIAYCFDTCSFEEAFGTSFQEARAAWEQSLMDRFGDGSEAPQTTEPNN